MYVGRLYYLWTSFHDSEGGVTKYLLLKGVLGLTGMRTTDLVLKIKDEYG